MQSSSDNSTPSAMAAPTISRRKVPLNRSGDWRGAAPESAAATMSITSAPRRDRGGSDFGCSAGCAATDTASPSSGRVLLGGAFQKDSPELHLWQAAGLGVNLEAGFRERAVGPWPDPTLAVRACLGPPTPHMFPSTASVLPPAGVFELDLSLLGSRELQALRREAGGRGAGQPAIRITSATAVGWRHYRQTAIGVFAAGPGPQEPSRNRP